MTRHAAGFTLTEMVVVLVIAVVLAAFAIPMFSYREIDNAWFHEQVRASVRYAQRTAVAQRRCVYVQVVGTQLRLLYGDASCAITAIPVRELATDQAFAIDAPSGIALAAAPNPFRFNGLGQPGSAAAVTVGTRTVTVNAETGYVE
jgi:MSHA pilin protein MshC